MKKFLLIPFVLLALIGCDKKYNNPIETSEFTYQVKSVNAFPVVDFSYTDSSRVLSVEFAEKLVDKELSFIVYASDGKNILSGLMYDNGSQQYGDNTAGDNIYSAKIYFKQTYPNGTYTIYYYISGTPKSAKPAAMQSFIYNNHQDAKPPVISNLIMPDSVYADSVFIFSVKVDDPNGLSDVKYVLFKGYRPDGSIMTNLTGDTLFSMNDFGDYEHYGDAVSEDGRFSYKNTFSATATKGIRRFEFFAIDRSGLLSNVITHYIKLL